MLLHGFSHHLLAHPVASWRHLALLGWYRRSINTEHTEVTRSRRNRVATTVIHAD